MTGGGRKGTASSKQQSKSSNVGKWGVSDRSGDAGGRASDGCSKKLDFQMFSHPLSHWFFCVIHPECELRTALLCVELPNSHEQTFALLLPVPPGRPPAEALSTPGSSAQLPGPGSAPAQLRLGSTNTAHQACQEQGWAWPGVQPKSP
jgi:hypothetical protein